MALAVDPDTLPQYRIELAAFAVNPPGGLGRMTHFKNFVQAVYPALRANWNPWLERMVTALCRETDVYRKGEMVIRATSFTGCGASGKTFTSGLFAPIWWMVDPMNSIAVLTSTSHDMVRKRVWPAIRNFIDGWVCPITGQQLGFPGHVVESKTIIKAREGDDLHAIFALPVAEGETTRAVARLKGLHAPRMLLVVDECEGTPESIFDVIHNWQQGCRELQLIFLGNATSHLNAHGRVCEPRDGWGSISIEWDEWPTKGWDEKSIPPGVCHHFDGFRSPNVVAGATKWHFLYSLENYQSAKDKKIRTLGWWSNNRGFWAPEGTVNTVLSEGMLVRCDATARPFFTDSSRKLAFFDPAFGGDQAILRFAEMGPTEQAPEGCLVLGDIIDVDPTPDVGEEIEFALARRVKQACESHGVRPEHFGIDAVGTGRGAAAVLATIWSPNILKYDGRGTASDDLINWEDDRPAKEVFDRITTENWFRVRGLLMGHQLKGLDPDTSAQFCTRTYEPIGRKYVLSTKQECRDELGHSPDLADAAVGVCWVARQLGLEPRDTHRQTAPSEPSFMDSTPVDDAYLEPIEY